MRCGSKLKELKARKNGTYFPASVPVVHIWYFRSTPSKISYLLGLTNKELERIIYYENYVIVNPGPTKFTKNDLLTEDEYLNALQSS